MWLLQTAAESAIDWGDVTDGVADIEIEVLDSSAVVDVTEVKGEELEEGVARGDDALTLLDHVPTRNDVINELVEVSCRCSSGPLK